MSNVEQMQKRQKVLADFGDLALQSEDLDEVLTEACRLVAEALGTDRAKVLEVEQGGESLFVRAGVGWAPGVVGQVRLEMTEHSSETFAIKAGEPVITQDIRREDRFELPDFLEEAGIMALVNVPVFLPGKRAFGLLQVDDTKPREFDQDDIAFLRTYATVLGPVIDRLFKIQELRGKEECFRAIVETATDYAIFTIDPEGRIETWPTGAQEVYGWTAEEALGQSVDMIFVPEDRAVGAPENERIASRTEGQAPDVRWHQRKDGSRVFIDGISRPLKDEHGKVVGFVRVGQDVTERRRAEEQLQLATEAAALGVFDVDLSTGAIDWDARLHEIWGAGPDEIITDSTFMAGVHPEDRDLLQAAIGRALDQKGDHSYRAEYRVQRRGTEEECWIMALGRVHFDGLRPVRLVGTVQDVTKRKQDEEALRASEARYRSLYAEAERRAAELRAVVESMPDAVYMGGVDGITLANQPALDQLGFVSREELNRHVGTLAEEIQTRDASTGAPIPVEDQAFARALRGERVVQDVRVRHLLSGEDRVVRCAAAPVVIDGQVIAAVAVNTDVTDRRNAEDALRKSEEQVREREARQAFLLRLSDALRVEPSADAVVDRVLQMLSDEMHLDRCYVGVYRLAGDRGDFTHQEGNDRVPPVPEGVRLSDFPAALQVAFDRSLVIEDVAKADGLTDTERKNLAVLGVCALVAATLRKGEGRPLWSIVAISADPRRWTPGEIRLIEEVTERTWAALERARVEAALRESEERFRQFGDASGDVLWIRDAETLEFEYVSPAVEEVYGTRPEDFLAGNQMLRWAGMILPEDRDKALDAIRRVRAGEHVLHSFRILRRDDGKVRWIRDMSFPLLDAEGRVQRVGGIGHDATEEIELQDRLKVLVAELQHRTRNLMGVVRSVTDKTLASSTSLPDFQGRIRDRLNALARVNSLLSRLDGGSRISFGELLLTELMAHGVGAPEDPGSQVRLRGPAGVPLRSSTVQTLALGLHELATNALKYGALSRPEGRLAVSWELLDGSDGEPRLRVDWRESGVPVLTVVPDSASGGEFTAPRRRGYGRELIERALPYQLKAETTYELTPDGVRCTITLPVSSMKGGAGGTAATENTNA